MGHLTIRDPFFATGNLGVNPWHWELRGKAFDRIVDVRVERGIVHMRNYIRDPICHLPHFIFAHSARRQGRRAEPDAARYCRRKRIERDQIFIARDTDLVQSIRRILARYFLVGQVYQQEMVIGSARHQANSSRLQLRAERTRVCDDLLLVFHEGRLERLFERDGFAGDDMLQGSALRARKDRLVNRLGKFCRRQNHSTPWTAQGFVSRRRDDIRVRDWIRVDVRGDESGDVCHIHHQP